MKNIFKIFAACGLILFAAACSENDDPKPEPDYTPAELKSVTFYAADNTNVLTEDYAVAAIADEMVVRIPGGGKGKTLVATLTAGENDIIKIDGEEIDGKATVDASYPIDILVTNSKSNLSKTYVLKVGKVLETIVEHIATYTEPNATIANGIMSVNPKDGMPYIFYRRKAGEETVNKGAVVKWNGASFDAVGTLGFTGGEKAIDAISMTFDSNGIPYVAYADNNEGYLLTVKKLGTGDWETVGQAGSGLKVNNSYASTMFFTPVSNTLTVLYSSGDRSNNYRGLVETTFSEGSWTSAFKADCPTVGSIGGSNGGACMFINSAKVGDAVYVLAPLNAVGCYLYKYEAGNCTTVIKDALVESANPYYAYIFGDNQKNLYVLSGDNSAGNNYDISLYKVDEGKGELVKYANTIPVGVTTSRQYMSANVNPVTGEVICVYRNTNSEVMYSTINKDLQWNDPIKLGEFNGGTFRMSISYSNDGIGYILVVTDSNTLELFKIGKEADELPE